MANGRHSFVAFYPSDWMAGTARLPRIHRSVYFDVCLYIWDTAKPVPDRELRLMLADLTNAKEVVDDLISMGKLERLPDGTISNGKALAEAEKAYAAWAKMSHGGRSRHKGADREDEGGLLRGLEGGQAENQNQNQNQSPPSGGAQKRATRLPPDFRPILTDAAKANAVKVPDYEGTLQQFIDHHTAKGTTMKDWQAAFRTWLTNEVKWDRSKQQGKPSGWR